MNASTSAGPAYVFSNGSAAMNEELSAAAPVSAPESTASRVSPWRAAWW